MRVIISTILIIAALLVFTGFVNPRWKEVKVLQAEEERFDEALDRSKELIAIRDALLSSYNAFPTADLNKLDTMIPDSVDTVRLIIDLNSVAARHQLSLSNIGIGEASTGASTESGGLGGEDVPYGTLTMSFTVSGTYDQFRALLADLERSLRIIDVTGVSFGGVNATTGLTNYTVSIKTYWMK